METIPLFPLSTVLLPQGKLALQIFEPRYLDLISRSLKEEAGFGVVWLREGSEVVKHDSELRPKLAQLGTFARIVDWDSLPNGLLGITIEGSKKFRVVASYQRDDHLHMAEVEWLEAEAVVALPEQVHDLQVLLAQLLQHPHIERLGLSGEVADAAALGCLLTQLLPLAEAIKFELLSMSDPLQRLERLSVLLKEYSE